MQRVGNKRTLGKIIRLAISYLVLTVMAIISIFPIYYIVITSLNDIPSLASVSLGSLLPSKISLNAYYGILFQEPFFVWLRNSLIMALGTIIISVLVAFLTGAALSRLNVPGKKALIVFLYILTFLPSVATVIPLYVMFASLHLINTYYGLILAYSSGTSIFGAYLVKIFIDTIPPEYEEAAMVDGLSRFRAYIRVLLPMTKPIVAFIMLLAFLGAYTDYALANAFITSGNMWTLTLGMYYLAITNHSTLYNVFAAFSVIMGVPIMAIFIAFQKYIRNVYSLSGGK
ncbi:sugar ABC transporter permease [Sulfolobus acidocaldarius SUSAZ]|nr:sugar ABC transporter permease [Sulfolobus acidocaldarius SUSAZ]